MVFKRIKKIWKVKYSDAALKQLSKFDKLTCHRIQKFIKERLLMVSDDPRLWGKALSGALQEFLSYRIGDYRVIAKIEDREMIIYVVRIGHRREIYDA